jgi:poly(A) polymerase
MSASQVPRLEASWLQLKATRRVMAALQDGGGRAWFVGGCVRDSLLDPHIDDAGLDIDVTTDLEPERVMALAQPAGIKAVPTGIEHGTVTLIASGRPFEVTTLRRDVATDGRRAEVAFASSLAEDAARRDFTINALYAAADGQVIDPLGGLADLASRRVRFVGDPERRILEDHLRILRFFRFFARFGGECPDPEGLAACIRLRDRLRSLSAERIAKELMKLLMARNVLRSLQAMQEGGMLAALDLADADPAGLAALLAAFPHAQALVRLAALFHRPRPAPGLGMRLAARLRLSGEERERLEAMLGLPAPPLHEPEAERRRRWYSEGPGAGWADRYLLAAASASLPSAEIGAALAEAQAWTRPSFPLGGADVLALGACPGPRVGRLLRAVEEWWVDQDMLPDRPACLAQLAARYRLDEASPDP